MKIQWKIYTLTNYLNTLENIYPIFVNVLIVKNNMCVCLCVYFNISKIEITFHLKIRRKFIFNLSILKVHFTNKILKTIIKS